LQQGYVVAWLKYIGNNTLAEMLKGVNDWKEVAARIKDYQTIQQKTISTKIRGRKRRTTH